jgi:hypothetical protein
VMSQWGRKIYPSWPSRHPIVTSGRRYPANPGNCRRISQGVAYHR